MLHSIKMATAGGKLLSILEGHKDESNIGGSLAKLIRSTLAQESLQDQPALQHNNKCFTFKELSILVDNISLMICRQREGDEDSIVGLLVLPGCLRIAAMLSCLALGVAYLALDEELPEGRMELMLRECRVKMILTTSTSQEKMKGICEEQQIRILLIDEPRNDAYDSIGFPPATAPDAENPLACVLYTSGSTGAPKGVKLRASNIMNRLNWYWRCFPFEKSEKCCHKTSMLFVDSLTEILSCVLKRICLVIMDNKDVSRVDVFIEKLHKNAITRLIIVPSLLNAMLDIIAMTENAHHLSKLKVVVCSGEALATSLAERLFKMLSSSITLLNFYGSTETTGDVSFEILRNEADVVEKQSSGCVCLGRPVDNTQMYIVNEEMKIVQQGTVGEVFVSGLNIADSYISANKSESNFVLNMYSKDVTHRTLYRMGDIGKIMDGRLYYEGRKDSQVKIRGKRVNLLEIEHVIKNTRGVESVVVLCCSHLSDEKQAPWTYDDKQPVAFIKLQTDSAQSTVAKIMTNCQKSLPAYMIPKLFMLDEFPLQKHTGKIDRQSLLSHVTSSQNQTQPLGIIAAQLGLQDVDLTKSFSALGGSSLGAVSVVTKLNKAGFPISLKAFVSAINIKSIIENISHDPLMDDGGRLLTDNLIVESLRDENKKTVIELLAKQFSRRNPLDILAGSSVESLATMFGSVWDEAIQDQLSMYIKDKTTNKVIAAVINFDMSTSIAPELESEEVMVINEAVELPVKDKLLQEGGRWIDSFLLAVDDDIKHGHSIDLIMILEEKILAVAKEKGYRGIITVNSHPVTAMIAKNQLGYTIENSLHVRSFVYNGKKPFEKADDDYYIHCMTKRI